MQGNVRADVSASVRAGLVEARVMKMALREAQGEGKLSVFLPKKRQGRNNSFLPGKPGTRKQLLPLLPLGSDGVGSVSATRLRFFSLNGGEERI